MCKPPPARAPSPFVTGGTAWMQLANYGWAGFFPSSRDSIFCDGPPDGAIMTIFARTGPSHIVVNATPDGRACNLLTNLCVGCTYALNWLGPYNFSDPITVNAAWMPPLAQKPPYPGSGFSQNPLLNRNNSNLYVAKYDVALFPGKPALFDDVSVYSYENPTCTYTPGYTAVWAASILFGCKWRLGGVEARPNGTCVNETQWWSMDTTKAGHYSVYTYFGDNLPGRNADDDDYDL